MGANSKVAQEPVIFFDGVCNLCNGAVKFIIKRDRKNHFKFASLQSDAAKKLLSPALISKVDSIILLDESGVYIKSDAALRIARKLTWPWHFFYVLRIFPRKLRDWLYDLIAKNRYQWFGKKDSCMMPTEKQRESFLDNG